MGRKALLALAMFALVWQRRHKRANVRLRAVLRALFSSRIWLSRSCKADYAFVVFNTFIFGLLFGWALFSFDRISRWTTMELTDLLGAVEPTTIPVVYTTAILTLALFLAYEFGYWLDHYISHSVPMLWEFHKVHHTAEVLTPLTNFRIHPVDTILFFNILAVLMGTTNGALFYAFGTPLAEFTISGKNVLGLAVTFLLQHLHHSHVWIAFTGWFGHLVISPAHHQIHHSLNPIHFDKNFGSCLGIFDWMFGTLHIPSKTPEKLTFGVPPDGHDPHSVTGGLITPLARALGHLRPDLQAAHQQDQQQPQA